MTIDTLKEEIHTTLGTTKKSFDLGELRILAVLFLLLRPVPVRHPSCGCDSAISRSRWPETLADNILIWFTLEFTKTYLGEKDA